jgi:hypothetical protein
MLAVSFTLALPFRSARVERLLLCASLAGCAASGGVKPADVPAALIPPALI